MGPETDLNGPLEIMTEDILWLEKDLNGTQQSGPYWLVKFLTFA